jgi:glucose-1-phosphate adenylyltransferase
MNFLSTVIARGPSTQAAAVYIAPDRAPSPAGGAWLRFASPVGTADAIYRNLAMVHAHAPTRVLVRVGDDAGGIDYESLVAAHRGHSLGATVGCAEVPAAIAQRFAVLGVDANGRVVRFAEKPRRPQPLPHDRSRALVSADIYVFDFEPLVDCLSVDAVDPGSTHDLARDVLPLLVRAGSVVAHVLRDAEIVSRYVPR